MKQPIGRVVRVRESRSGGFGFIRSRDCDLAKEFFFHRSDVEGGQLPSIGCTVSFVPAAPNRPGREMRATCVRVLDKFN
jgi:cold shock CspA family protein